MIQSRNPRGLQLRVPILFIIVMTALAFALVGCGGGSSPSSSAKSSSSSSATKTSVATKSSTEEYTWEELSAISLEIGKASSEDAAVEIAKKYNLTTEDGKLNGTQTKSVTLSNGIQTSVQIVGFAHDDKTDGGKAGITFVFKDCVTEHDMNSSDTNAGGWKKSQMRSWLASEGMSLLPDDLRNAIVEVNKKTNNVGATKKSSSVSVTADKLWLYSAAELGDRDPKGSDNIYNSILEAEGSQYKLYRDMNVINGKPNDILVKQFNGESYRWWERSPRPSGSEYFRYVDSKGDPGYGYAASGSCGVVPGFCI